MNEIPGLNSFETKETGVGEPEQFMGAFGSVYLKDGHAYVITHDGEGIVPVPNDIAATISLALRTQDKVYSGDYPHLAKRLALLNCRKSAFAVTGALSIAKATDAAAEDLNGIEPLLDDVQRIQNEGYSPHIITESNLQISELLDNYEGKFPAIVHVFEIDIDSSVATAVTEALQAEVGMVSNEIIERMHRIHTFLVLGEDESGYVCFQKMGPELEKPFTVSSLDEVVFPFQLTTGRESVVFIGPSR